MIINAPDTALIFEGGGMRASYSSGVLNALLENEIFCGWVGGISAGSSCTVNYLSRDLQRTKRSFVEFSTAPDFGSWRTFIQGKGLFNAKWIYEEAALPGRYLPYDFDAFLANPAQFRIGAIRCTDSRMVYWGRDDVDSLPGLMKRVRASSTMPVLMPWTTIDGTTYCDGALGPSGGIALDAARADGFEKVIVVLTRERGYRKAAIKYPRLHQAIIRNYPAVVEALVQRPANYNRTLDELAELEAQGRAFLLFPDEMPFGNSERSITKLQAAYEAGLRQTRQLIPEIREFACSG